jgi:uncharacterized protein
MDRPSDDRRERLDELLVVDCDVHVHESPRALIPYIEPQWRTSLEVIKDHHEVFYLNTPGFSGGGMGGGDGPVFPSGGPELRVVETPEAMRSELSEIKVDIGILFPDHLLKLALHKNPDYALALTRAYNAWLVEEWCDPDKGLLGVVIACPQEPADSAREIERYGDDPRVVGVYLPTAGINPLWGDRRYHPIFGACEETGLPALLHSVTVITQDFPFNLAGFDNSIAIHGLAHTFSIMANLTSMVTSGIPVRFPGLTVVACEAGITWVPFLMNRLDKEYVERRREVPFLTERPSHYLKQWYYATQPIEEPDDLRDLALIIEAFDGEDRTVFASDWPHHDFDHPMKVAQIPLSNEARRKVLGENALRLFGIDRNGRRVR